MTWHDAMQYCRWASKAYQLRLRLPTSEEWKFAAGGSGKRDYPWLAGEPDDERANFEMRVGRVTPVGLFPRGNSPEGIADLAGNVWEWTSSDYDKTSKVIRGGAFDDGAGALRAGVRIRDHPGGRDRRSGFRCVRE